MDFFNSLMSNGWLVAILMLVGLVLLVIAARKICGAFSTIPRSVCVCFSIIFIYVVCIALTNDSSSGYTMLITAMPFGESITAGDVVDFTTLYQSAQSSLKVFFEQLVQIFYLAVIVNFIQSFFHRFDGKKAGVKIFFMIDFWIWYVKECVIVFAALIINMLINMGLSALAERVGWAGPIVESAPMVIFIVMAILLVVISVMKVFKAAVFATIPVLGVFLTFFSENRLGKSIISAFMATGIMVCLISILGELDINLAGKVSEVIQTSNGIMIFVFTLLVLLFVWFIVYRLWKLLDKK